MFRAKNGKNDERMLMARMPGSRLPCLRCSAARSPVFRPVFCPLPRGTVSAERPQSLASATAAAGSLAVLAAYARLKETCANLQLLRLRGFICFSSLVRTYINE